MASLIQLVDRIHDNHYRNLSLGSHLLGCEEPVCEARLKLFRICGNLSIDAEALFDFLDDMLDNRSGGTAPLRYADVVLDDKGSRVSLPVVVYQEGDQRTLA